MATNPFGLLLRGRESDIPELVEALRRIHNGKAAGQLPGGRSPTAVPPQDLSSLLPRLAQAGLDLAQSLDPRTRLAADAEHSAAGRYRALRDRFAALEGNVQRHAAMVDRLVARQTASVGETAYQETLYLQCPRGKRTEGRFRCVNHQGRTVTVTTTLRPFMVSGAPTEVEPIVIVRPSCFTLQGGASKIVSVEVDLQPCPELVGEAVESSIDLHMDGKISLKVWIRIDVYERS